MHCKSREQKGCVSLERCSQFVSFIFLTEEYACEVERDFLPVRGKMAAYTSNYFTLTVVVLSVYRISAA